MAFKIWHVLLCFIIKCYGGGQPESSKLLEKIQNLFAVYANTFDQINIFHLDLLQNMSLHLK